MRVSRVCGEQAAAPPAPVRLVADVSGEMAVDAIPVAPAVDFAALTEGDEKPLQVVVRIPEGLSRRNWYYTAAALGEIADEVNRNGLPGFLGHQRPEDVETQFPTPVTHWVGAKVVQEGGAAALYMRGVVDKAATDLKRWIRAKTVRQTSIFGQPVLAREGGETRVVGYRALSNDWTPLNRAGMPTAVVAMGEMDVVGQTGGRRQQEDEPVTLAELLAKLREELKAKNTTPQAVLGELGITLEDLRAVGEVGVLHARAGAFDEVARTLGADPAKPEEVVKLAQKVASDAAEGRARAHAERVNKVVGEKVKNERARPVVRRLLRVDEGADEAAIAKAVDELLADQEIAGIAGEMGAPPPAQAHAPRGATSNGQPGAGEPGTPAGLVATTRSL